MQRATTPGLGIPGFYPRANSFRSLMLQEESTKNSPVFEEAWKNSFQENQETQKDETTELCNAWLDEKMSPLLLPYAEIPVMNIVDLIENQVASKKLCIFIKFVAIIDGRTAPRECRDGLRLLYITDGN